MKKTVLIFPGIHTLSDFIQDYMISGVEVNTLNLSLTSVLTEHQVADACNNYQATLRTTIPLEENYINGDAGGASAKRSCTDPALRNCGSQLP